MMRRPAAGPLRSSMHNTPELIEEQASLWAARLDGGELSAEYRAELQKWLNADSAHRAALVRYQRLSDSVDACCERRLAAAAEAVLHKNRQARRRRPYIAAALATAAAFAVMVTLRLDRPQRYSTPMAGRESAILDDGSRIELNALTEVSVTFTRKERRAEVSSGEALFSVEKDNRRPFRVVTPSGVVTVTGTVFNVRAASTAETEITVLEGSVRVQPQENVLGERMVPAGSQALLCAGAAMIRALPPGAAEDAAAWRQGWAVFSGTPLQEVFARFAPYHRKALRVDPAVASLRLGGRYSLDDFNGLLEAIESILPVRVSHLPDSTISISASPAD